MLVVQCPTCKKPVEWSEVNKFRPFCSKRCRLIDLGAWADGTYSIQSDDRAKDDEEQQQEGHD